MNRPRDSHRVRALPAAAVALVVAMATGACSTEDRAAIASAKCAQPVAEKAGFPEGSPPRAQGIEVEELGKGSYRVTGRYVSADERANSVSFVCEVAPDASDKFRGFKVTRLEVTPD